MEDKIDLNIFSLNGDKVEDIKVANLLELDAKNVNTIELNYEILSKARAKQLKLYPNDADKIHEMFDTAIYWLKVKLAARGLYHDKS